jgi:hypothetical protein
MADIRYTTAILDDFNRADEDPIAAPWTRNWAGVNIQSAELRNNQCGSSNGNPAVSAQSYLSTESFTGSEIECWASAVGDAAQAESFRMGLCDGAVGMNGYILRCENPVGSNKWAIRKYTNGSATELISVNGDLPGSNQLVLMQLTPAGVFCYISFDTGANWTLRVSHSDTTYRSGLFPHLGANGGGPAWDYVGAGVPITFIPQFYRRPYMDQQ